MKRNYFKNFFGHLYTITHHRHLVIKYGFKVGIGFQSLRHDLSKYSLAEFFPGVKYYSGTHSPTQTEREDIGASLAWMHHKGRNKHHHEYWSDFNMYDKGYTPVEMPIRYVKEMFCDRIAASKVYKKKSYTDASALEYFMGKKHVEKMHPKTAELIESWLVMLKEKGEKETCKYIKKISNKQDKTFNMAKGGM